MLRAQQLKTLPVGWVFACAMLFISGIARAQSAPAAAPTTTPAGVVIDGKVYPTNFTTIDTPKAGILGLRAIDIPRPTQTGPLPDPPPTRPEVIPAFPRNSNLPTIWTIGDSTVRTGYNGTGDDRVGQWGWGCPFVGYFDPAKVNVVNRAWGGTTSGSFYNMQWKLMVDLIKKGDVVILQFGTNSGGVEIAGTGDETREVPPRGGRGAPTTARSFGWFIRQFIAETRAKGATPVVCSLIPRNSRTPEGTIRRSTTTQAGWAREVAAAEGVGFIDLNELVARKYDAMKTDEVNACFTDGTHTSWIGAVLNAETVISGLKAMNNDPVAAFYVPQVSQIQPAAPIAAAPTTLPGAADR